MGKRKTEGDREMRGVGGPLLCIGDLLNDVGEGDSGVPHDHPTPSPYAAETSNLQPSDLPKLFQVFSRGFFFFLPLLS